MRILIVTPYLPWPLDSGGNAAQYSTLQCLADDHAFTLVCPVYDEIQRGHAKVLSAQLPKVRIRGVFCGPRPVPAERWILRLLRRIYLGLRRRLAPVTSESADRLVPPEMHYPFRPLPDDLIAAVCEEIDRGTDLVQTEFAEMLSLGAWLPAALPKLFVHHQVHAVYVQRFLATHGTSASAAYLAAMMHAQEQCFLTSYDGVIAFSDDDQRTLRNFFGLKNVYTSPFPIPADIGLTSANSDVYSGRFIFIGSERHAPNQDALQWLLTEIWPQIAVRLPTTKLIVIGDWSERWRNQTLAPQICFTGFVSDLASVLHGGIMLVPVRVGSGIRTKILAAFAQGVPVVSTFVGSEGLGARDNVELQVRNSTAEFATAAVELAQTPGLRRRLAAAALTLVMHAYSPEAVRRRRNEVYGLLTQNRPSCRPSGPTRD